MSRTNPVTKVSFAIMAIALTATLSACGENKDSNTSNAADYNKCLETEAAKYLDETGSNLDYANEMAAKNCEKLK